MTIALCVKGLIFLGLLIVWLLWLLYDNGRIIKHKQLIIGRLEIMLKEEQAFREMREDSLAELVSEELALPISQRRLCVGCVYVTAKKHLHRHIDKEQYLRLDSGYVIIDMNIYKQLKGE